MIYNIYTDGGTRNNGDINATGGFGVYIEELDYKYKEKINEHPNTNQKAELLAGIRAIQLYLNKIEDKEIINNNDIINLYSDSAYLINGMNSWIHNWKKNGWINSKGEIVANLEYWKELALLQLHLEKINVKITWNKVKGHSTNVGNIIVDKLANEAMDMEE